MNKTSKSNKAKLEEDGYLLIKPNLDILELIKYANLEIDNIGKCYIPNFDPYNVNDTQNANLRGFYKAIRNTINLYRLATAPSLISLSKELGVSIPVLGPSAIRVDIKEEENHQFNWHQDAVSLLGSKAMYTYWIPLTDVSKNLSSIEVIPKSHNLGILDATARDPHLASNQQSFNMQINDPIDDQNSVIIEASAGSILVIDPFLVHRSYYPRTTHPPRRTAIIRLDEINDKHHLNLGLKNASKGFNLVNSPEYLEYYRSGQKVVNLIDHGKVNEY